MAPRKGSKNTLEMADGTENATVTTAGVTLSAGDLEFLAQCLSHTDGGKVVIDCTAVAKARGISNPRSIANRLATFRSKTGIPLVAGNTSGKVDDVKSGSSNDVNPGGLNSSNGGSGGDEADATASPVKITPKRKAPAKAKTPRAKKVKATATPAESESEAKVEESASQESAVAVEAEVEAEIVRD